MTTGASAPLTLRVTRSGATAVLRVAGEVDLSTSDRLRERLRDLVERKRSEPVRHLVVDASDLQFLDVTGLRVLLDAEAGLRHAGGTLVLRSPTHAVRRLLDVLDRGRRLRVEES